MSIARVFILRCEIIGGKDTKYVRLLMNSAVIFRVVRKFWEGYFMILDIYKTSFEK